MFTLFRNQIQPKRSATDQFSSNFIDFLKYFTESFLKNGPFFDFLPILGYFFIFGTFLHFWVVLGEPVSYKITRGVKLVVGRVIEGVWWFFLWMVWVFFWMVWGV